MSHDVMDLRDFYTQPLGHVVRRLIAARVRSRWRDVRRMSVMGVGYTTPFLGPLVADRPRLGALMPAEQGVLIWPEHGPRRTALVETDALPLPDSSVDLILAVHCLEVAEGSRAMLDEFWRVLTAQGRVMLVVPNRRGVWARFDTTPFGHGQPYSRSQLARLLRQANFTPTDWTHALYMPPFNWSVLLRSAIAWERVGAALWPMFSGVIIVEATKQLYAMRPRKGLKTARQRLQPVPAGPVPAGGLSVPHDSTLLPHAQLPLATRSGGAG